MFQVLSAHNGTVHAVAFSPDGKYLVSYSYNDNKLLFWQVWKSAFMYNGAIVRWYGSVV